MSFWSFRINLSFHFHIFVITGFSSFINILFL
jgi:hypothetical protein